MQQEQVSPTVRELKQEAGFPNARVTNDDVPAALVMHHCKAEVRDAPGATIELSLNYKYHRNSDVPGFPFAKPRLGRWLLVRREALEEVRVRHACQVKSQHKPHVVAEPLLILSTLHHP